METPDAASLLDLDRIHRRRTEARRRRSRRLRHRARREARHARAAPDGSVGRAPAHPRGLGRAQHRPRRARRHREHRRRARRQDLPGQLGGRRGDRRRRERHEVQGRRHRDHPLQRRARHLRLPLRIWAYDQPDSIGWYGEEAVVGDWQLVPAPLDVRTQPVGDRRAAAARADRVPPVAPRARHVPASRCRASARRC